MAETKYMSSLNGYVIKDKQARTDIATVSNKVDNLTFGDLKSHPTTLAGYGITDDVLTTDSQLNASKISGTIPIENLPASAVERVVVVADDTARFALTVDTVQVGDTVKVLSTKKMYFVKDDSQLSTEAGYEEYAVGEAGAVEWDNVKNKPSIDSTVSNNDHLVTGAAVTSAINTVSATAHTELPEAFGGLSLSITDDGDGNVTMSLVKPTIS